MHRFSSIGQIIRKLGPGLMFAGAAVGVSHLVQSTRAGAYYGFDLLPIIIVVHIIKYPFFEIAPRYVAGTGKNLVAGYHTLGRYAVALFALLTLVTMFPILAAILLVTAGIFSQVFSIGGNIVILNSVLLLALMLLVLLGHYNSLDKIIKWIILILTLSTISSLIFSVRTGFENLATLTNHFDWLKRADILFLIAFIGWMPSPIDVSVWSSMWSEAKQRNAKHSLNLRDVLFDFRIGYWGTALLAIAFLMLGAIILKSSGETLSSDGAIFAGQLINIYTNTLGSWAYPVIAIAALTTMLSTSITVMDAYPRLLRPVSEMLMPRFKDEREGQNRVYRFWLFVLVGGTLILVNYLSQTMRFVVDMATTISFITTPLLAILNYKAINHHQLPEAVRQPKWLKIYSLIGIFFLSLFSLVFVIWRFLI